AVAWARQAGFEQVSLDLIYGTPGESLSDWQQSIDAALACAPDHVSAYSLIVEEGTALARQVRSGLLPMPEEDDLADKYALADEEFEQAGLGWYEVSNWARAEDARCRHNELYWTSENWLGIGPGAHAHVGGVRWWNVKHPTAYAARLAAGESPAFAREVLDDETRRTERVLLEVRLRDGLPLDLVDRDRAEQVVSDQRATVEGDRLVLTRSGRLLADAVVRDLLD
ncbi:MAG: coproporphyrinogen oxidase, partial [Marmoricola sp.]|nr:coproporphyrinogen oxidase [Marmoricola sp.]